VVVAAALALGLTSGGRPLEAVALPGAVAIAAGAVQLARAEPPTVTRSAPEPGFPGDRRTVAVAVESALPCTVTEPVGEGLVAPDGAVTERLGHGGEFEYTVALDRRGRRRLGPARCRLTDSLGLFRADVETEGSAAVIVYPQVYELAAGTLPEIEGRGRRRGRTRGGAGDRSVFDRLRPFAPGDSMRDIHWRASAKRTDDEFVVREYEGRGRRPAATVVGEATPGGADAMASVVGSVALHLAAAGVDVTVAVPGGERSVRADGTDAVLRLLAVTDGGTRTGDERRTADVSVRADGDGATVRVAGRTLDFEAAAGKPRGRAVVG
jgi:uncharacterized protein (DUF58 family)